MNGLENELSSKWTVPKVYDPAHAKELFKIGRSSRENDDKNGPKWTSFVLKWTKVHFHLLERPFCGGRTVHCFEFCYNAFFY